jgi:uncharacterized protein YcaQ
MSTVLQQLRRHAVHRSLFPRTTLAAAIDHLGFVQADPIRAPARAQDLILRQRVHGYHAGDLERQYASLDIEEDYLYAYGFLPRAVWRLLHPRRTKGLRVLERKVLGIVQQFGELHPADLEEHLGHRRVINAWGGYSKATTQALEDLHYRGLLRIARRDSGIRVYAIAANHAEPELPDERLRKLILLVADILAPIPEKTLRSNIVRYRHLGQPLAALEHLKRSSALRQEMVDGVNYLWSPFEVPDNEPQSVRFLAPFDPLVWDRARFEHFWGWAYRFEAYTPRAKRVRGYYALPLLWRDQVIGWVNASVSDGELRIDTGFAASRPRDSSFHGEFQAEVERLNRFLSLAASATQP